MPTNLLRLYLSIIQFLCIYQRLLKLVCISKFATLTQYEAALIGRLPYGPMTIKTVDGNSDGESGRSLSVWISDRVNFP